jgi:hypothetical protein
MHSAPVSAVSPDHAAVAVETDQEHVGGYGDEATAAPGAFDAEAQRVVVLPAPEAVASGGGYGDEFEDASDEFAAYRVDVVESQHSQQRAATDRAEAASERSVELDEPERTDEADELRQMLAALSHDTGIALRGITSEERD